jgi:hypothetical protein
MAGKCSRENPPILWHESEKEEEEETAVPQHFLRACPSVT